MPLTLLLSFLCLRLIKNSELARSQVIISNPTFYHAPSNQEKLPKAFQKQLWASPPTPCTASPGEGYRKQPQEFTNIYKASAQLSPQRIWGRNALFVSCHSSEWSTSSSSAPTHGWQWAFTPAPRAAKQHKGIYTCRQISFSSLAGEVRCALFLSAGDSAWQPHKKHLGGRVNAPAESSAQACKFTLFVMWTCCSLGSQGFSRFTFPWVNIGSWWEPMVLSFWLSHEPEMKCLTETAPASLTVLQAYRLLKTPGYKSETCTILHPELG